MVFKKILRSKITKGLAALAIAAGVFLSPKRVNTYAPGTMENPSIHPKLVETLYNFYRPSGINFDKEAVKRGSINEDSPEYGYIRAFNHFQHGRTGEGLSCGSLCSRLGVEFFSAAKVWVTSPDIQAEYPYGDHSWDRVKEDFFSGKIGEHFGYLYHVLCDLDDSSHPRNDIHPVYDSYEHWTNKHKDEIMDSVNPQRRPSFNSLEELMDNSASFTYSNFPSDESWEGGVLDGLTKKTEGDKSYWVKEIEGQEIKILRRNFFLNFRDDACYSDAWRVLGTKAVEYGAAAIKILERETAGPDGGVRDGGVRDGGVRDGGIVLDGGIRPDGGPAPDGGGIPWPDGGHRADGGPAPDGGARADGGSDGGISCIDDTFEPNDTRQTAWAINVTLPSTYSDLKICPNNEDWYKLAALSNETITVQIDFVNTQGDLDLRLYNTNGDLLGFSNGISNREVVQYTPTNLMLVIAQIYGYGGASNTYSMTISSVPVTDGGLDGGVSLDGGVRLDGGIDGGVRDGGLSQIWTFKSPMSLSKWGFGTAVVDDKIYVMGGVNPGNQGLGDLNITEQYNPNNDGWTIKANMPTTRLSFGAITVNRKIYAMGGLPNNLDVVESYNPLSDSWSTKNPMPNGNSEFAIAAVGDKIYVIGGIIYSSGGAGSSINSVYQYDSTNNNWNTKTSMPTSAFASSAVVQGDKIYVTGGFNTSQDWLSKIQVYNTSTNMWIEEITMPCSTAEHQAELFNNQIYIFNGGSGSCAKGSVMAYNLNNYTWSNKTPFPFNNNSGWTIGGSAVISNIIYIMGGNLLEDKLLAYCPLLD